MTKTTPLRAIRRRCLDCCCGSSHEVKLCPATDCPLHSFRLGKNPNIKPRNLTPEQRAAAAERLAKARKIKAK